MSLGDRPAVMPFDAAGAMEAAVEALWAGGIVGIPTETVYGLCVLPHAQALAAVIRAKRRPEEKGIALMVDAMAQVEALAHVPEAARRLAERFWPGPLTLVLPPREEVVLPDLLFGASGALGFRLPDHPTPRSMAARLGPIAVTSANISGEPDSLTAAALIASVGHSLALVLDGGTVTGGIPSTVIAFDGIGRPVIVRPGALRDVLGLEPPRGSNLWRTMVGWFPWLPGGIGTNGTRQSRWVGGGARRGHLRQRVTWEEGEVASRGYTQAQPKAVQETPR